ncbi:hypothetical protein BGZ67_008715 [Mortierella alpina]|nr:hypothetical protein BGZ67_008715 [Mortierella alpina]
MAHSSNPSSPHDRDTFVQIPLTHGGLEGLGQASSDFFNTNNSANRDNDSHMHDSYSAANGHLIQGSAQNNTPNHNNNNNNSNGGRRAKNHPNLDRLHTQNLSSLRPNQGQERAKQDNHSERTVSSHRRLRADGAVLNPNKLRPKTSALTTSICSTIEPTDCASFNGISRMIHRHYSRVDYVRSEADLLRESFLIGNIKFSRWAFLPAAFCFQAVCGTLYAWSVFNSLIDNELYSTDGTPTEVHRAAITFYIALGCFGVSSSLTGPWLERHGPRKAGLMGATLFLMGNLVTAVGIYVKQISLVYIGYGILGGLGLGISYISPVSSLQKWFPDRRGVAAGLAVSGFGAGSIVMAKIPDPLSAAVGLPITFVILGVGYFVIMVACAFVFRVPPPGYVVNGLNVWAQRVDIITTDADEMTTPTEFDIQELGMKMGQQQQQQQQQQQPGLFDRPDSTVVPGGNNSVVHLQSLHPLHPLARRSLDDNMPVPLSPVSASGATMVPGAASITTSSRRNSAKTAVRTNFDPSISMNLMESFYSREFRLMYIMFLGNTMAGVVIISRLANIATDIFGHDKDSASTIVSINGGFNLVGRLAFASLSDRIGRKNSYVLMLVSQAIILSSLPFIMRSETNWAFLMTIWILTSCYGGGFGCIPAFLCDMFGPSNIGPLHGVILTSWSVSSVGAGLLFTFVYNHLLETGYTVHDSYIYAVNLNWILAFVVVGLVVGFFVRTELRDRLLPTVPGEFFHSRVCGRILRFGRFGFRWVSKEQEQQEWAAYVMQRQLEDEQGHSHQKHGGGVGGGGRGGDKEKC